MVIPMFKGANSRVRCTRSASLVTFFVALPGDADAAAASAASAAAVASAMQAEASSSVLWVSWNPRDPMVEKGASAPCDSVEPIAWCRCPGLPEASCSLVAAALAAEAAPFAGAPVRRLARVTVRVGLEWLSTLALLPLAVHGMFTSPRRP